MKRSFLLPALVMLGLVLLADAAFWVLGGRSGAAGTGYVAPVIILTPRRGMIEKSIRLSAQVETGRLITLVSRASGTLTFLSASPGTPVREGETLAQVDSAPYDLTYLQAQAAFNTAQSTFNRLGTLYNNQAASRQNYEEARMAYEAARAQYELAQLNRDYTRIRSPLTGVILQNHSIQGATVQPGTPLLTLGDLADIRIKAWAPEIHYRYFAENFFTLPASITVPALGGRSFELIPLSLAPYVSPATRSFLTEYMVKIENQDILRPGMSVNLSFVLDRREDVYSLPFSVLTGGNRLWYVDEEGNAAFLEFVPDFFNEDVFEVPPEYRDYPFIREGQHFLSPGQKVKVVPEVE
ncbi:MAG: efflux RND transporter periplasmic adaptor subunit [Spirochaetales bacterium]|jgi:RND family efflux transporter MFP subunit|nr:efflux RND transporter periplasmic adaptor subunit [Spirochaetales bacterium]